jgi:hypothetical protein
MRLLAMVAALTLALSAPAAGAPSLAASGCPLFPADNVWHADVSRLPVHPRSAAYLAAMGTGAGLHADFGAGTWEGGPIGIPYTVVPAGQARVPVRFAYAGESDPGPYPVPPDAPVEGGPDAGGDRHVLVVQAGSCRLYELFDAHREGGGWRAGSGAVWDLRANRLRPDGWTSADAAGLPILPGLVRYEEVARGRVDHAIRVTVDRSQAAHLWPARHHAGQAGASLPPMGLRLRLRPGVDLAGFPFQARVILQAMRTHGLVVADNGSSGFIGGVPDDRWDNDALHQLGRVTLADFEAVDTSSLRRSPASAAARPTPATPATRTARPKPEAAAPFGPGRRWFQPEPHGAPAAVPPGTATLGAAGGSGTGSEADGAGGSGTAGDAGGAGGLAGGGLVPRLLALVLGLTAAALATRAARRPRHPPAGRHVRRPAGEAGLPDPADAPPGPAVRPPDADPAATRGPGR